MICIYINIGNAGVLSTGVLVTNPQEQGNFDSLMPPSDYGVNSTVFKKEQIMAGQPRNNRREKISLCRGISYLPFAQPLTRLGCFITESIMG